jgi:hypothetical protein
VIEASQFVLECIFSYHAMSSSEELIKVFPDKEKRFGIHINERGDCPDRVLTSALLSLVQMLMKVLDSMTENSNVSPQEKKEIASLRRSNRNIEDLCVETLKVMTEVEGMTRPDLVLNFTRLLKNLERKFHLCLRRDSVVSMLRFFVKGKVDLSVLEDKTAQETILLGLPGVPERINVYSLAHAILSEANKKQGHRTRSVARKSITNKHSDMKKVKANLVINF